MAAVTASGLGLAGAAGVPLVGLAGQIISTSQAAAAALGTAPAGTSPKTFRTLARVLRAAAEESPVTCLIDNADEADGRWWSELLPGFAVEIADELPLFMFLTLEGDAAPGPPAEDEPDVAYAARELVGAELAEWWPIPEAGPAALLGVTGRATNEVISRLLALSYGRMGWPAELWENWKRTHRVQESGRPGGGGRHKQSKGSLTSRSGRVRALTSRSPRNRIPERSLNS